MVNVLAVRHYSMDSAPVLELDGDGNAYVQSMDFKAEVNYIPSEFEVTSKIIMVPENAYHTEIVSYEDNPDVYTLSVTYYGGTLDYNYILLGGRLVNVDMGAVSATFSRSGDGYDVSLGFGGRNFNYRFTRQDGSFNLASGDVGFQVSLSESGLVSGLYNVLITLGKATKRNLVALVGDSVVWVDSSDRVLTLSNESSTNDKMVLLVTQTETNSSDGANGASGYYLLNTADGETKLLRFSYYLEGWTSHFTSSSFGEGVSEQQVGDDFTVTYGGVTFKGAAAEWHKAVLNY
ncbi:MAG: hypothetical protein IJ811_03645 [Clostridia bacterium]|nr:hypothetical protein [Clostridia bacterium]